MISSGVIPSRSFLSSSLSFSSMRVDLFFAPPTGPEPFERSTIYFTKKKFFEY